MNRRGFLGLVGGTVAAVAVAGRAQAAEQPDAFVYRGWDVRWRGWREPVNQNIAIGIWSAIRGEEMVSSTTLGVVQKHGELDVIDCTRMRGVVLVNSHTADAVRRKSKADARGRLLKDLDARA